MSKIIILKGFEDAGKTTCLNLVIDSLIPLSERYSIEKIWSGVQILDRRCWFELGDKKIGICTPGDDEKILSDNIGFMEENDCDIFLMATRAEQELLRVVNEYALSKQLKPKFISLRRSKYLVDCIKTAKRITSILLK